LEEGGNQQKVDTAPLWVISLGRLGMREFDLGSDADLTFVLADEAARNTESLAHWTRIAERMVAMITAYTGSGNLFAVDTRLRPYGGAGPLVMGASRMLEYFERDAEAWEGITYLKARAVAGDPHAAEAFLMDLQQTYWNRYGAAGSSRAELRKMRQRLEEETGKARPLKAGSGGYYDIDFVLLFLRLRNAGIYYRALNTPARIKALEAIGALNAQNASFLTDAATFYRAVDHAIRLISGKAEGHLPKSSSQRDNLESILPRWTPIPLHELKQVQLATRALFTRIFG
jgi:glutamate-ammonia-ligase adenylyltransferase